MSLPSISRQILRSLLIVHLLAIAWSIVALSQMWPREFASASKSAVAAGGVLLSIALLATIGISSAHVGEGTRVGRLGLAVHGLWTMAFLYFYSVGWGPLAIRFSSPAGSLEDFSYFNKVYPLLFLVPPLLLVSLYSGIPLCLSHYVNAFAHDQILKKWPTTATISGLCFAVLLALVATARFGLWGRNEAVLGLLGFGLLTGGFVAAAVGAARGNRLSTRLLLCEAGMFALVQVVRTW